MRQYCYGCYLFKIKENIFGVHFQSHDNDNNDNDDDNDDDDDDETQKLFVDIDFLLSAPYHEYS